MFNVGDWVEDSKGKVGYIDCFSENKQACFVRFPKINRTYHKTLKELKCLPVETTEEDIHTLQHMAVISDDKEWFTKLYVKKERLKG